MKSFLVFLTLLAVVGCGPTAEELREQRQEARSDLRAKSEAEIAQVNRYHTIEYHGSLYRFDTVTGRTWILLGTAWSSIPSSEDFTNNSAASTAFVPPPPDPVQTPGLTHDPLPPLPPAH